MARRRGIDARCDDGGGLLDERASLEGDPGERSDVSSAQRFTRGDGAGQHHRALSMLGNFVLMGVGRLSARGMRGSGVVCRRGFLDHRFARGAADRGDNGTKRGPRRRGGRWGGSWGKMRGRGGGDKFPPGSGSAAGPIWTRLITQLKSADIEVRHESKMEGIARFARIHDPEGNAIELREPVSLEATIETSLGNWTGPTRGGALQEYFGALREMRSK